MSSLTTLINVREEILAAILTHCVVAKAKQLTDCISFGQIET